MFSGISMADTEQSPFPKSYSQADQDLFVLSLFGGVPGTFLDFGCSYPVLRNNTYLLEKRGWSGVCLDNDPMVGYELRTSPFIQCDGSTADLSALVKNKLVDYLSLDTDRAGLVCLQNIIHHGFRFKFATVEHDAYQFGNERRSAIRNILQAEGYSILVPDVQDSVLGLAFEDWWVDTTYFSQDTISRHTYESQSHREILLDLLGFK